LLLAFLPPLALVATTLAAGNRWPSLPWRLAFLRVTVALGAAMILGTEALGLVGAVTRPVLTVLWLLPTVLSGIWLMQRRRHDRLRKFAPALAAPDSVLLVAMLAAVLLVAIVAWAAPVQTWDSLTYHMSRVAHWAQNASLRPFATGIERQLYMPPGAEIGFLQAYVLGAGDRWVNLVNWTAWVCAAVVASFVAARLGAPRTAQLAGAALVISLPMAVSQASSTMTDLFVGLWLLACAGELLWMRSAKATLGSIAVFALAAGLAANTKPTAYVALMPLGLWFVIDRFQHGGWRAAIGSTVMAGLIAGLVLLPHWSRNLQVYGSPLGPVGVMRGFANERMDPQAVVSNLLRNAALHAGTPIPGVSEWLTAAVVRVHAGLRIDPNDDRTTAFSEWTRVGGMSLSEVRTGNTLHLGLLLAALAALLLLRRRMPRQVWLYAGMLLLTLFLYSLLFKWQVFGNRLHLPYFLLACPLIAAILGRLASPTAVAAVGMAALVLAWPWATRLTSRPLLPSDSERSVLHAPRLEQTFRHSPGLARLYPNLTVPILSRDCTQVGIELLGDGAEYPLWTMLGAPRRELRIEWLVAGTPSARYADPSFEPCAVICQGCPPEDDQLRGLPVFLQQDRYTLYMAE
jgi:hypothetical protein